jgi:hypothetical protein
MPGGAPGGAPGATFRKRTGASHLGPCHIASLVLGAVFAHLGWIALHLDIWLDVSSGISSTQMLRELSQLSAEAPEHATVASAPVTSLGPICRAILDPTRGHSILFVPLGPLAVAGCCAVGRQREIFRRSVLRALVPALAIARLGCLAAGCCGGVASRLPWAVDATSGVGRVHPVALYELACWLLLATLLHRLPARRVAPAMLLGFGTTRLLVEPWRAPPPLGEPWIAPESIALSWLIMGAVWWVRAGRRCT